MKKITTILVLTAIFISLGACKSGKAGCDAYSKINKETKTVEAAK
jgi:hypothetical protein